MLLSNKSDCRSTLDQTCSCHVLRYPPTPSRCPVVWHFRYFLVGAFFSLTSPPVPTGVNYVIWVVQCLSAALKPDISLNTLLERKVDVIDSMAAETLLYKRVCIRKIFLTWKAQIFMENSECFSSSEWGLLWEPFVGFLDLKGASTPMCSWDSDPQIPPVELPQCRNAFYVFLCPDEQVWSWDG